MTQSYQEFLEAKRLVANPSGVKITEAAIPESLFDFQRRITAWALRRGRAAIFSECGTGKTAMQLIWSNVIARKTNLPVLILAPLGVTYQTVEEGQKFGVIVNHVNRQPDNLEAGIYVTNYEKLHLFNPDPFGGVVIDESSCLKHVDSKTRIAIIEAFHDTPYRLACTATPAPNDHMELGNHAEFLGIMTRAEMLAMFFTHDGGDTSKWRLKGHAVDKFWKWVTSWAVMVRRPSDLGFEDGAFILPELTYHSHVVASDMSAIGQLFDTGLQSLNERRAARKASLSDRVSLCADLVRASDEQFLIWCDLNAEQDTLAKKLDGRCASIQGSTSEDDRLRMLAQWRQGRVQAMISKPSIFGFGLNLQNCHNVVFVGLSDSWESYYQATRRVWRFGQEHPVNCHVITSEAEGEVLRNIQRKEKEAIIMQDGMLEHMKDIGEATEQATREETLYRPSQKVILPSWLKADV